MKTDWGLSTATEIFNLPYRLDTLDAARKADIKVCCGEKLLTAPNHAISEDNELLNALGINQCVS